MSRIELRSSMGINGRLLWTWIEAWQSTIYLGLGSYIKLEMSALVLCSIKFKFYLLYVVLLGTGSWWVDSHLIPLGHSLHGFAYTACCLPGIKVHHCVGTEIFAVFYCFRWWCATLCLNRLSLLCKPQLGYYYCLLFNEMRYIVIAINYVITAILCSGNVWRKIPIVICEAIDFK